MKYFFVLIALLFAFGSCTTDLDIPLPEHEVKLTLYSFLSEGQPIDVYLSRSFGLTEKVNAENIVVKDAKVELFKDGQLLDIMVYKDSSFIDTFSSTTYTPGPGRPDTTIYYTNVLEGARYFTSKQLEYPKAGESYKFVVTHDTYGTVQAETKIPQKVEVSNIKISIDSLKFRDIEGYEMDWTALKISLQDPAGSVDYFNHMVGVDYGEKNDPQDTFFISTRREWQWPGTEILRDPDGYTYTNNQAISDEGYDGQLFSSLWWINLNGYNFWNNSIRENFEVKIKTFSMTKSYAQFQKKLFDQTYNRLSGIESAFVPSEPVVIPSNVEGGYGLVGSYNISEDYIIDLR